MTSIMAPYLGVNFNIVHMNMSIPAEKLTEVRDDRKTKTKTTKKGLQKLLAELISVTVNILYLLS